MTGLLYKICKKMSVNTMYKWAFMKWNVALSKIKDIDRDSEVLEALNNLHVCHRCAFCYSCAGMCDECEIDYDICNADEDIEECESENERPFVQILCGMIAGEDSSEWYAKHLMEKIVDELKDRIC